LGKRSRKQQDGEQGEGVNHAGDGSLPPERMFVAVRAMAPVAGIPPNRGDARLANSLSDQLDVRVMAVSAHPVRPDRRINDSIAPKSATVNAGESSGTN